MAGKKKKPATKRGKATRKSTKKSATKATAEVSATKLVDLTNTTKFQSAAATLVGNLQIPPRVDLSKIDISVLTPWFPKDVPGSPAEPVYSPKQQDDIQGNTVPGFNKDHQQFLFYRICRKGSAKRFLKWIAPLITSMEEVIAFRRLYRKRRLKLGRDHVDLCSTWINIAFSHSAIARLTSKKDAAAFGDQSFRQGLAERSGYLGDPTSRKSRGHPSRWLVGGPKDEADITIIVASDGADLLKQTVRKIKDQARRADLELMFEQNGQTLPGDLRGHEHFGFRDGISQPGVRGKLSSTPGDYITPRYMEDTDPRRLYMAKPGQFLAWPGQFLLGEDRQSTESHINSTSPASNFPDWARRGSYLVMRRLSQDVRAFWRFAYAASSTLGMDVTRFASMLVGRWPSGAPVMRVPAADNPALGGDEFANNHFIFDDDTRPSNRPIPGYPGDTYPQATADFLATVCPHFAHVRKVNPRDTATEMGKPEDSLTHMILRRGIPFGKPIVKQKRPSKALCAADRGLMFLCYGSTIEDQFEFVQRRWANSRVQPNLGGHDPIIGQNGSQGSRTRTIDFPTPSGSVKLKFKDEWILPTGGGYFFAPPISAIAGVLAS